MFYGEEDKLSFLLWNEDDDENDGGDETGDEDDGTGEDEDEIWMLLLFEERPLDDLCNVAASATGCKKGFFIPAAPSGPMKKIPSASV